MATESALVAGTAKLGHAHATRPSRDGEFLTKLVSHHTSLLRQLSSLHDIVSSTADSQPHQPSANDDRSVHPGSGPAATVRQNVARE